MLLTCVLSGGCATVQIESARSAWLSGDSQQAIASLSDDSIPARDRLLASMEKGLIQHETGDYAGSVDTLLSAVKLLESKDFLSVSELSGSLIVSEWATTYKGEYAERLWLHTYLIMNFLLLEQYESAAVEARKALKVYSDHSDVLENEAFSRLLAAVAFDTAGQTNDAYVAYRNLARLHPDSIAVAAPLSRIAAALGQFAEAETYRRISDSHGDTTDSTGDLIIFLASGIIPKKLPGDLFVFPDIRISFPVYPISHAQLPRISAHVEGAAIHHTALGTQLHAVIAESLAARGTRLAAKQAARLAVKNALAESASSDTATDILKAVFFVLEEADTRSWQTLPSGLTLVRVPLPEGEHVVTLRAGLTDEITFPVSIIEGKSVFRHWRISTD